VQLESKTERKLWGMKKPGSQNTWGGPFRSHSCQHGFYHNLLGFRLIRFRTRKKPSRSCKFSINLSKGFTLRKLFNFQRTGIRLAVRSKAIISNAGCILDSPAQKYSKFVVCLSVKIPFIALMSFSSDDDIMLSSSLYRVKS
jgi:hypothetical protein